MPLEGEFYPVGGLSYAPDMDDRFLAISEIFQDIEKVMAPVIGNGSNAVPSLYAESDHFLKDPRRVEEEIVIYIERCVRLGVPGTRATRSDLGKAIWVV